MVAMDYPIRKGSFGVAIPYSNHDKGRRELRLWTMFQTRIVNLKATAHTDSSRGVNLSDKGNRAGELRIMASGDSCCVSLKRHECRVQREVVADKVRKHYGTRIQH